MTACKSTSFLGEPFLKADPSLYPLFLTRK